MRALREALNKRDEKTIPTEELLKMADLCLKRIILNLVIKLNNKYPELQLGLNLPHHTCVFS